MKKVFCWVFVGMLLLAISNVSFANDYENGSMEESSQKQDMDDSKKEIQEIMSRYVASELVEGVLRLKDGRSGRMRRLGFMRFHESVGMKDGQHFSCADFKDVDTGDMVDVDIFIDMSGDEFKVSDAVIHKVNGQDISSDDAPERVAHKKMPAEDSSESDEENGY